MADIDYKALKFKSTVPPIVRWLARLYLKINRWTVIGGKPEEKKYILLAVYHTSNWDAVVLVATAAYLNLRIYFMGKHTLFRGPLGVIVRFMGGIPVDRGAHHGVVGEMVEIFNNNECLALVIPPEGTRKKPPHWKTGYYHIAREAKVPIRLGRLDYGKRETGIGPALIPSGDMEKDIERMKEYYADCVAKYPENACGPSMSSKDAAK